MVAEKFRIRQNPLSKECGPFVMLTEDGTLKPDEEGLQKALRQCANIVDVIVLLPFLSVSEDDEHIVCEFCPTVVLKLYRTSNSSSQR